MRLTIEKIVYPGRRLAAFEGKTVFTDEGLPGEIVEAEPVREKKDYLEATTVRILRESAERVAPRCPHYLSCSPYQSIAYPYQLEIKKAQIAEILGGVSASAGRDADVRPSPSVWNYRNRIRMRLIWDRGGPHLAYSKPHRRDEFVAVEECHLVSKGANALLRAVLKIVGDKEIRSLREIEAKESRARGELALILHWEDARRPSDVDPLISGPGTEFPVRGIVSVQRARGGFRETTEWGEGFIEDDVHGATFMIGARSFFQVNLGLLDRVMDDLERQAEFRGDERLADLYAGVGTFGLAFSGRVSEVCGVESDPNNISFLKRNVTANRATNYKIHEGPAEEWAPVILSRKTDIALLDPPRKGLEPATLKALLEYPPARVFYLSCNPTTLARDLKELGRAYEIASVRGYDFFPHTPHIEILAALARKERRR